jgi:hypothetical protein
MDIRTLRAKQAVLALLLLPLVPACGRGEGEPDGGGDAGSRGQIHIEFREGCAGLIPEVCAYPYPSMAHLRKDPSSPTGWRVNLTKQMLPFKEQSSDATSYFLGRFNVADGFSIATPILALLPDFHVNEGRLPRLSDLGASVLPSSPVQVLDRLTGARVPVWVEMDNNAVTGGGFWNDRKRTMMIRPQMALEWNRRYAVVLTAGLKDGNGPSPKPQAPMSALVGRTPTDNPLIEGLRPDYEPLFGFLAENGVPRDSIVLAWEFHTMSRDFAETPVLKAVAEGRRLMPPAFEYRASCQASDPADRASLGCADQPKYAERLWRRLEGRFETPRFACGDGYIETANGTPVSCGAKSVTFVAGLPLSAKSVPAGSLPVIQIGHGLMSAMWRYLNIDGDENGVLSLADKFGALAVGADFSGLSTDSIPLVAGMIEDFSRMWTLHDAIVQGLVEQSLLIPFVLSTLKDDPALRSAGGGLLTGDSGAHYYGISLGGMMGVAHAALSPEIRNFVFNVPSAMFSSILQHSSEFKTFQSLLANKYPDPVSQQILLAFAQRALDPIEPANWHLRLFADPLTPLGRKNALWQVARNDCNAPDFGAYALLRTAGIPLVIPSTHAVWGSTVSIDAPSPPGSSGMVIYDTGRAEPSLSNSFVPDNGAHFTLRCNDEVHGQIADFFAGGGTIRLHCGGGPCFMEGIECRTGAAK